MDIRALMGNLWLLDMVYDDAKCGLLKLVLSNNVLTRYGECFRTI